MGRDKTYPNDYTQEISDNLDKLLIPLNKFREIYGIAMTIASGWRPPGINANTPGAASHSNHMLGLAADFHDPDGKLDQWCLDNLNVLEDCGLWLESPNSTPNWCHLQCVPPHSGNRVFIP